jgi:glycosyltransferase involved in cell wall biosynthesis
MPSVEPSIEGPNTSGAPLVSIITNSYNSSGHLANCIKSVVAQDYQNWEHLIVDCGSTDGSIELVTSLTHDRLRLIRTGFCGVAQGRKIAIAEAKGSLLAVLDSDDVWHPARLSRQIEELTRNPTAVAVGCGIIKFDQRKHTSRAYGYAQADIDHLLEMGINPLPHSTLLMRHDSYALAGGYSDVLEKCEDYELLLRLRKLGPLLSIADPLVQYVSHAESHTEMHKPLGRDQTYYAVFALILNATTPCRPEVEAIHRWLTRIGPDGVAALHARWALRGLLSNLGRMSTRSHLYLISLVGRKFPSLLRAWRKPWWNDAASPSDVALAVTGNESRAF